MRKKLERRYNISRIITKMVFDSETEEERVYFDTWLNESPRHHKEYELWMERLPNDLESKRTIDVNKAWKRFETIRRRQYGMYVIARKWYAIAALVAVILTISGGIYYGIPQMGNKDAVATIVPGSERMILQTGTGDCLQVFPSISVVRTKGEKSIPNEMGVLRYDLIKGKTENMSSIYHTMVIPRGGEYQVVLSDGTHIYMNAESEVKYPIAFPEKGTRNVYVKGEAYLEVAHNVQSPFIVHTCYGTVEVRGTKFNVCDYKSESYSVITLAEGSVICSFAGKEYLLKPGMQFCFNKQNRIGETKEVDVTSFTSWHTGLFEFNSQPLGKIMSSLAHWYDIDYQFKNAELANYTFTGVAYRKGSLQELLYSIEKTTQIHFHIKGRTIFITQ